jgi:hypothetical protein
MTESTIGRVMTLRRAIVGRQQRRQALWTFGLALVAASFVLIMLIGRPRF